MQHMPLADPGGSNVSSLSTDDIMLALSLDVDPSDGGPLSNARRKELQDELDHGDEPVVTIDQAAIEAAAEKIMAQLAGNNGMTQQGPVALPTIEEMLNQIDPRDSETALAMFQWLIDSGRVAKIGSIDGGGYLWHYSEPKGTTKQGYTPGATQGGRMVDEAVEKAKASGAVPIKRGLCDKCFSAVRLGEDGTTIVDDATGIPECPGGGTHNLNA